MRGLFITTETDHEQTLLDTWKMLGHTARRVCFNLRASTAPDDFLEEAFRDADPDIIFYSGGNAGPGLPTMRFFEKMRNLVPLVHLCWDSADAPWHPLLEQYKSVFTLQVGMDGVREAPVDHVTLYPIDPRKFPESSAARVHKCGFAGDFPLKKDWLRLRRGQLGVPLAAENPRAALLYNMPNQSAVTIRRREFGSSFADYVEFLQSCQLALNTAYTGSGERLHMKMRHLEIPLAGCALLDTTGSPARDWFPEGSFFSYASPLELEKIIAIASDEEIAERASFLRQHVLQHYSPHKIWKGVLDRVHRA